MFLEMQKMHENRMQMKAEGSVSHDKDCRQVRNEVQIEKEDVLVYPLVAKNKHNLCANYS